MGSVYIKNTNKKCLYLYLIIIFHLIYFFSSAIPFEEASEEGENIMLVVTSHGGHLGFLEGLLPHGKGYVDRVMSEYIDAIFKFGADEL